MKLDCSALLRFLKQKGLPVISVTDKKEDKMPEHSTLLSDGHVVVCIEWSRALRDKEERNVARHVARLLRAPALMVVPLERKTIVANMAHYVLKAHNWSQWFKEIPYAFGVCLDPKTMQDDTVESLQSLGFESSKTFDGGYYHARYGNDKVMLCRMRAMSDKEYKDFITRLSLFREIGLCDLHTEEQPDYDRDMILSVFNEAGFRAIQDCPNPDKTSESRYPMAKHISGIFDLVGKYKTDGALSQFFNIWRTHASYHDWLQDQQKFDTLLSKWRELLDQTGWEKDYIEAVYVRSQHLLADLRNAQRFTTFEVAKAALWPTRGEEA